jgi:chromosome segregation ATPase
MFCVPRKYESEISSLKEALGASEALIQELKKENDDNQKTIRILQSRAIESKNEIASLNVLKQQIEISETCLKAELMHVRLSYQEDINDKNQEIKALKMRVRNFLSKTTDLS